MALVQTVLGPVEAASLGPTLPHEHLLIDLWPWFEPGADPAHADLPVNAGTMTAVRANPFAVRDNLVLDDLELAAAELAPFAAAGGRTVVDLTLSEIGRRPAALAALARATGLNVVMGTGRYIAAARPTELAGAPTETLRDALLRDIATGEDGVRPGIIGEIGTSDPIHPDEARMVWAAAEVQAQTGLGLVIHLDPWGRNAHAVLDHALGAGADPARVMLAHLDPSLGDASYARSLAERGVTVAIDIWGDEDAYGGKGMPTDEARIATVLAAFDGGWADRLALSQDVCLKSQLRAHGGPGYAHLLEVIAPRLRAAGLGDAELDLLFITTPRRLLAGAEGATR